VAKKPSLSASSISDLRTCQRLFYWRRVAGLRPIETPRVLRYGIAVHRFLEDLGNGKHKDICFNSLKEEYPEGGDDYCRAVAMCEAYIKEWGQPDKEWDYIENEIKWTVDCGEYTITGRIDAIVRERETGQLWVVDHKTTSKVDMGFVDGLARRIQTRLYCYVGIKALKQKVAGIIYNVLEKPGLRRLQANSRRLQPEDDEQFIARLGDWYDKELRFSRFVRPIDQRDGEPTLQEVYESYKLLEYIKARDYWQPNDGQCHAYNRRCDFLSICESGGVPGNPGDVAKTLYQKEERKVKDDIILPKRA